MWLLWGWLLNANMMRTKVCGSSVEVRQFSDLLHPVLVGCTAVDWNLWMGSSWIQTVNRVSFPSRTSGWRVHPCISMFPSLGIRRLCCTSVTDASGWKWEATLCLNQGLATEPRLVWGSWSPCLSLLSAGPQVCATMPSNRTLSPHFSVLDDSQGSGLFVGKSYHTPRPRQGGGRNAEWHGYRPQSQPFMCIPHYT